MIRPSRDKEDAMTPPALDPYVSTDVTGEMPAVSPAASGAVPRRATSPGLSWLLRPDSPALTLAGVAVAAVGFALIGVAWAEIAALTDVGLQLPYLVSAGMTGLGLVMVGLMLMHLAAKRQDGAARDRQNRALVEAVTQLRQSITDIQSELHD